jgi:pimeloyl-ACP methyl ester carboxylesterase
MTDPNRIASSFHSGGPRAQGRPPLVLIHGAGGNRLFWPPRLRRIEAVDVYALDLPGHGESGGAARATVEGYAAAVVEWMRGMEVGRGLIAGHSMGGAIALTLALLYPERVAGLILVGSGGRLRVHPDILTQTAQPDTFRGAVDVVVEWSFSAQTPPRLTELARQRMIANSASVLHNDFLACDRFDVLDSLGAIRAPTLVLCGQEDRLTPEKYSHALAERIDGAHLVMIPGAGHMVMLEQPEAAKQAIERFLEACLPSP